MGDCRTKEVQALDEMRILWRWLASLLLALITWILATPMVYILVRYIQYGLPPILGGSVGETILKICLTGILSLHLGFIEFFTWGAGVFFGFEIAFLGVHLLILEFLWRKNPAKVVLYSLLLGFGLGIVQLVGSAFVQSPVWWRTLNKWEIVLNYGLVGFIGSIITGYVIGRLWYALSLMGTKPGSERSKTS